MVPPRPLDLFVALGCLLKVALILVDEAGVVGSESVSALGELVQHGERAVRLVLAVAPVVLRARAVPHALQTGRHVRLAHLLKCLVGRHRIREAEIAARALRAVAHRPPVGPPVRDVLTPACMAAVLVRASRVLLRALRY